MTSVWVGNDNSSPMKGVTGGTLPATIWRDVMVTAEDGVKATPLNKSSPQAPVEDTTEYDSGLTEAPAAAPSDDESGGASTSAENEPHQQNPAGEHRNFFDWLFGGRPSNTPPPPPPPPPPQSGDSDRDNDSN